MAVSYPGVYIEEFTPGSPIAGIGMSTVAFVGTAEKGPIYEATRLHSWDAFKLRFGDFLVGAPVSYLAPAVYGFFLNGGTDCFILRAATAAHSHTVLVGRGAGAEPVLVAEAIVEGLIGDAISVEVQEASLLDDQLGAAASTLAVHVAKSDLDQPLATGVGADRQRAQVKDNSDFTIGETVVISATGTASQEAIIKEKKPDQKTLVFETDVPGNAGFANGGSVRSIDLLRGQREIRVVVPTGLQLQRALPHGATVRISDGAANPDVRTVDSTMSNGVDGRVILTEGLKREYDLGAQAPPSVASLEFNLIVSRPPLKPSDDPQETFANLSMHPEHPNYWGSIVDSQWVRIREPDAPPAHPADDPRPKVDAENLKDGADDDRGAAWASLLVGAPAVLAKLDAEDEIDIIAIPGATGGAQGAIRDYCEQTRRFGILDSRWGIDPNHIVADQADNVRSDDGYVALYYPWIRAVNPLTNLTEYWPPSGHVAGLYARTDARVGVHAAPANDILRGALGLERRLSNDEQGPLNVPGGVNVLRVFPGQATPVVWGARTTALKDKYWQYVNIRRLFLFLEGSIEQGIQWAVFQPNNLTLWEDLRRSISDFLTKVWQDGALFGATAKEAFYVRIDEALNPESERALGRLHIEIGVAPTYPAEFIIVRIGIWQGGSVVAET